MKKQDLGKSIRISNNLRKKLLKIKLELDCKSIDEVIKRLLKISRKIERREK